MTTGEVYHYAETFLNAGDAASPLLAPGQLLETGGSLSDTIKEGIVILKILHALKN
ncbi:hypothetical protein ACMS1V_002494 [Cronobacter dublinensis]